MTKQKNFKIKFPVLNGYTIHVIFDDDVAHTDKKYKLEIGRDPSEFEAAHLYKRGVGYLVFRRNPKLGTVAHECYHAVRRMLIELGLDLDNETVAYHVGYLVQSVWDGR